MAAPRILYLHGFCSSPASWKARLLGEHLGTAGLGDRFACPLLSPVPLAAIATAEALLASREAPTTLVGSSLGGYYASWLAEKHDLRAVLTDDAITVISNLGEVTIFQINHGARDLQQC